MAMSSVPKNFRDGILKLEDNTGAPLIHTVQYEDGDFSAEGFQQANTNIMYEVAEYFDRGDFNTARRTMQKLPTFQFTAHFTDLSDATDKLLWDCVLKTGAFAAGVSYLGATADVWALKLTWTIEGTNYGDSADHTLVLGKVAPAIAVSEGDPNKFTITGKVYGTAVAT